MENIKDTNVSAPVETTKPETNSQELIDNAVASAKKRWEKKLENNYVSIDDYNTLKSQLTQAQNELKLPKLQQAFVKAGGKQEAFNDFVKLNSNLFDAKDEKEVVAILDNAKKKQSYMFNNVTFNANVGSDKVETYTNGSLLRTK